MEYLSAEACAQRSAKDFDQGKIVEPPSSSNAAPESAVHPFELLISWVSFTPERARSAGACDARQQRTDSVHAATFLVRLALLA